MAAWADTVLDEEVEDGTVGLLVGVLEVETVAGALDDGDLDAILVLCNHRLSAFY